MLTCNASRILQPGKIKSGGFGVQVRPELHSMFQACLGYVYTGRPCLGLGEEPPASLGCSGSWGRWCFNFGYNLFFSFPLQSCKQNQMMKCIAIQLGREPIQTLPGVKANTFYVEFDFPLLRNIYLFVFMCVCLCMVGVSMEAKRQCQIPCRWTTGAVSCYTEYWEVNLGLLEEFYAVLTDGPPPQLGFTAFKKLGRGELERQLSS